MGLVCALVFLALLSFDAWGQSLLVDRQTVNYTVRDMLAETQTTFLPDTTLDRLINYAQHETMLALKGQSSVVLLSLIHI